MYLNWLIKISFVALLLWSEALAQPMPEHGLTPGGSAIVRSVSDGDTIRLEDGRRLRLVGIQAPERPPQGRSGEIWPLADEAKSYLEELVLHKKLQLFYGKQKQDRHRRILAHAVLENDIWVQGALLKAGLAHVYSFPDNRALVAELYAIEDEARKARLGIWADPYYQILQAEELDGTEARYAGRFRIVEGVVQSANDVRGRVYLNFGPRWSSDFTAIIERRVVRQFKAEWIDNPQQLKGRHVQLRGWMHDENGPMIRLSHPEQLRFLQD